MPKMLRYLTREDMVGMEVMSIRYVAREGSVTRDGVYVTFCPSMPNQSSVSCGDTKIAVLLEEGQTLAKWIEDRFPRE
ncbi:MAG: hypothetical protein WAP74_04015 [Patescibacteria group bacterium]